ncbi:MAG TPA: ABC transporter ATP-binding protein [Methylomirabilota bacterium]|jgi:iron(III) transport system ATP-binding protein|nr:ABC transporter ATP-binding protein [Methylomirabilota bacterium]
MAAVRLQALTKRFGEDVAAVHDLTIDIRHGELLSLLGPSGCGKTTTLRLIAGFLAPDAGEIWLGDRRLSAPHETVPPERRGMSMLFQSYAVWPHKTVAENVTYGLKFRSVPRVDWPRRLRDALALVRLEGFADRYPGELSGGQQQRVALARALIVEPAILLLDEPLSNLDAHLREEMRFEIRRVHEASQITTVYVTHDQAEAMVTSDRIAVMNAGGVEQVGTPAEVYERPATAFVAGFIGRTNLFKGRIVADGRVACEGGLVLLTATAGEHTPGDAVAVSVRPHMVTVSSGAATGAPGEPADGAALNVFAGTVTRASYFGDAMDYLVAITGTQSTLRATGVPEPRLAVGQSVGVRIAARHCILVR